MHPQWLIFRHENKKLAHLCHKIDGTIVDIGCAEQSPRQYLSDNCEYFGLDYPTTAKNWYHTQPNIYGDAQKLPLKTGSIDNILLIDVLEHIPSPQECLKEIHRTLKPHGELVIRVPFMYPIHDSPLDFHRWSIYGLNQLAKNNGFSPIDTQNTGKPVETAAALINIALTKTTITWAQQRNPIVLLMISLAIVIPLVNVIGMLFSILGPKDTFMPYSYTTTWQKINTHK